MSGEAVNDPGHDVPNPALDFDPRSDRQQKLAQQKVTLDTLTERMVPGGISASDQTILEEKPHHMMLAYMLAAGKTRTEIAQQTGMTAAAISRVTRQPWFVKRMKEICEATGKDHVKAFLEGEIIPSFEVLREVRDNPDERGSSRILACNSILDRFLGKPTVTVESKTNLNINTAGDTVDQVQHELSRIDAELSARGVKFANNGTS